MVTGAAPAIEEVTVMLRFAGLFAVPKVAVATPLALVVAFVTAKLAHSPLGAVKSQVAANCTATPGMTLLFESTTKAVIVAACEPSAGICN